MSGQKGGDPGNSGFPRNLLRPAQKVVEDLAGGQNLSKPPDQIGDTESPDMLNLVYVNKVLCVDFGYRQLGSPVLGYPQQPINYTDNFGIEHTLLVTTATVYEWDNGTSDWRPIPINGSGTFALVDGDYLGDGTNPTIPFTGVATWVADQPVMIERAGGWYVAFASGTTSPCQFYTDLLVGQTLADATAIIPLPMFTADAEQPVSWIIDPQRNKVIFTNGFNPVQETDGTECTPLPGLAAISLTAANYIARYHGVTVLANVVEGGTRYPYRVRRSATGNAEVWDLLDAGFDDLVDTNDAITGLLTVNPYLAVLRTESVVRAQYYGIGLQVFFYEYALDSTGTLGKQSWGKTSTASMFISESGIFHYGGDFGMRSIGENIFNGLLTYSGELHPNTHDLVFCVYIAILDETWTFYADQNGYFANTIWRYRHQNGAWFKRRFSAGFTVIGAGFFRPQVANTWNDLVGTRWIDRHKPWNARSNLQNYHGILLCNSEQQRVFLYDFNRVTTDDGVAIPWHFVSKDYPIPHEWKTLDSLTFYGKGIVNLVEISRDYGVTWQELARDVTMGPTWARRDAHCSLTCEFVRVRFSGTDPSFKLSWFAFSSMTASEH